MRIKNKKTSKKAIIIISIIAVIAVAGGTAFALREQLGLVTPASETTNDTPTDEQIEGENTTEQQPPATEEEPATEPEENVQPTNPESTASEVIISSINQEGNTLAIRTIIQPLVSGGKCTLAMSKVGSNPVRQTAGIQSMPSYSTCQGFDINVANMAKGSWNVEITYTHNGKSTTGRGTAVIR